MSSNCPIYFQEIDEVLISIQMEIEISEHLNDVERTVRMNKVTETALRHIEDIKLTDLIDILMEKKEFRSLVKICARKALSIKAKIEKASTKREKDNLMREHTTAYYYIFKLMKELNNCADPEYKPCSYRIIAETIEKLRKDPDLAEKHFKEMETTVLDIKDDFDLHDCLFKLYSLCGMDSRIVISSSPFVEQILEHKSTEEPNNPLWLRRLFSYYSAKNNKAKAIDTIVKLLNFNNTCSPANSRLSNSTKLNYSMAGESLCDAILREGSVEASVYSKLKLNFQENSELFRIQTQTVTELQRMKDKLKGEAVLAELEKEIEALSFDEPSPADVLVSICSKYNFWEIKLTLFKFMKQEGIVSI